METTINEHLRVLAETPAAQAAIAARLETKAKRAKELREARANREAQHARDLAPLRTAESAAEEQIRKATTALEAARTVLATARSKRASCTAQCQQDVAAINMQLRGLTDHQRIDRQIDEWQERVAKLRRTGAQTDHRRTGQFRRVDGAAVVQVWSDAKSLGAQIVRLTECIRDADSSLRLSGFFGTELETWLSQLDASVPKTEMVLEAEIFGAG